MKKRWIILIILVLLIGIGWYNFFIPHGSARKRLEQYKKELIAKGEKLDMLAIAPPRKEDANNGANAFLAAIGGWRNPNQFTPSMKMMAPGAAMIGHTNLDELSLSNREANVTLARKVRASLKADLFDFGINYSTLSFNTLLPHLAQLKASAILFSETAMQSLYANDLEEAVQNLGAIPETMRLWGDEPIVISCLVRIACLRIGFNSAWEALQHEGWQDQQLAELQRKWEGIRLIDQLEASMEVERFSVIAAMAEARLATNLTQLVNTLASGTSTATSGTFGDWLGELTQDPKAAVREAYERYPKFWLWKSKWSFDEEIYGLELYGAAIEAARDMKKSGYCAPALTKMSLQVSNCLASHPGAASHFMVIITSDGWMSRAMTKVAQMETARRLLIAAIGLERYHLRHGTWPASLAELVPDFIEKVPLDFMDGKPLRYRRVEGGTYVLYSVGLDGVDDGSDPSPQPNDTSIANFLDMRDIVWPQPATEFQIREYEAKHPEMTNKASAGK